MESDEQAPALRLHWEWRDDVEPFGLLAAQARWNGFEGYAEGYAQDADVLAFAARLRDYPLAEEPGRLFAGYLGPGQPEEHVGIAVRPRGARGQIGVAVHLRASDAMPMEPGERFEVWLEVPTAYESLNRFADDLEALVADPSQVARLHADPV